MSEGGKLDLEVIDLDLGNTIQQTLRAPASGRPQEPASVAHQASRETPRPLCVLLAEDNRINQLVAVTILKKVGHSVVVAINGREAINALENEGIDVVLMDVQMPGMDGLEVTAEIRKKEIATGRHVPIVALTAHAMPEDRQRCLDAGMDGYLSKPFNARDMIEEIERLVPRVDDGYVAKPVRSRELPQGTEHLISPSSKNEAVTHLLPAGVLLDRAAMLDSVGGSPELLRAIIGIVLRNCPGMLSEIRSAVSLGDSIALRLAAHSFRGAASNFLTKAAIEATMRLELMGKQGDLVRANDDLHILEQEIARAEPELSALGTALSPL